MKNNNIAATWARNLGLVEAPLFSTHHTDFGQHSVLLNGGRGSFAVSESDKLDINRAASWVWSADIPHHVFVSEGDVLISRWDNASLTRFSRLSIENKIEEFYKYLLLDRVKDKFDIVEHSVDMLRRIRSHASEQQIPDQASIHIFLYVIAAMLSNQKGEAYSNVDNLLTDYAIDVNFAEAFRSLGENKLTALIEQFRSPSATSRKLETIPQLLVRHAGGTVFQEAHFEFIRGKPTDLFSLPGAAEVKIDTRGGTHFTPPGLARAMVEQALGELHLDEEITVFDPACGAGAFLHEVLRFLERNEFRGRVYLIGYDLSPNAVAMARFALDQARKDWSEGQIEDIDIQVRDSLSDDCKFPQAHAILMNPPFISWGGLEQSQREQVKTVLGKWYAGRSDYSMAFVEKALSSVKVGGVIGTLLPSSILSLEASLKWRNHILDEARLSFLAVLGDHGLFRHAIVEVACAILVKGIENNASSELVSVWTNEKRGASGEALRNLRKLSTTSFTEAKQKIFSPRVANDWRISTVNAESLRIIPDWRPRPNRLEGVLNEIQKAFDTTVKDIFHVREGIRAGLRKAFIVSPEEYQKLPQRERKFFRPIVENKNIRSGRITAHEYIFYPGTPGLEPIETEADLQRLLPTFFRKFLEPHHNELTKRVGLGARSWWLLNHPRTYFIKREPKLVSAFFGDAGSFALDVDGDYVVVQGFAWFPQAKVQQEFKAVPSEIRNEYRDQISHAYLALLNSKLFSLLLAEFCPHVAGGQYNLSKRFVDRIPLPNLVGLGRQNSSFGEKVELLSDEGHAIRLGQDNNRSRVNELVAEMYRVPLALWLTTDY